METMIKFDSVQQHIMMGMESDYLADTLYSFIGTSIVVKLVEMLSIVRSNMT